MAKSQQMVSETRGIGQLLSERRYFEVPSHQRDFAWPIGVVEQFLDDIVEGMSGDDDYFLGLIVLVDSTGQASHRYEILDGQQRLATTTMTYAAIRQWLRDHNADSESLKIQNEFIGISEIGEASDQPRLVMNINNREVFQEIVVNPCSERLLTEKQASVGRHTSVRKLIDAAIKCRQYITHLAEVQGTDLKNQCAILYRLAKYLRDKVQVNCLDVTAPENAYTIFESLNDRGIDLSVLDLLKNHLLKATTEDTSQTIHNWTVMLSQLGDRKGDDFLKVFWTSRFGRIQRGSLFREMKKKYATKDEVLSLSKELACEAEKFSNIEVSDSELWNGYSAATQEHIKALSILGGRQTHPIILASLKKFTRPQVETMLKHLVTLIVRYQLIGRGRTGRLEIKAASVSSAIYMGQLGSPKAAWDQLRSIIPSDEEFIEDFMRYTETKASIARWILRELELQEQKSRNPRVGPVTGPLTDPEKVNLEHILPKNPGKDWKLITIMDKEILEDCRYLLGNMCLLDKSSNKEQAAKKYADKVVVYRKSPFLLTQQIADIYSTWDRAAIEDRQKKLAQIAVKAWML